MCAAQPSPLLWLLTTFSWWSFLCSVSDVIAAVMPHVSSRVVDVLSSTPFLCADVSYGVLGSCHYRCISVHSGKLHWGQINLSDQPHFSEHFCLRT